MTQETTQELSRDGIVIQARSGSTRMPAKILLPFSGEKRIIDIVIENIKRECPGKRIVLATTVNPADDILEEVAAQHQISCFRGSEENVLQRFIGAADKFGLDRIIRVCSDNPFLDAASFNTLFDAQTESGADYVCFAFPDGRPTIKSHLGLFAELATTEALKKAAAMTDEKLYLEHVTIFLYTHPDLFSICRIPLPEVLRNRTDLRLTLDTPSDFKLLNELFALLQGESDHSLKRLIEMVDKNPEYGKIMKTNILQNEK